MKKINMKNFKTGPTNVLVVAAILLGILLMLLRLTNITRMTQEIPYSTFEKKVKNNQVKLVRIIGSEVVGIYNDGALKFETRIPANDPKIWDLLREHNVEIAIGSNSSDFSFWHLLFLLSLIVPALIAWWVFRAARNSNGNSNIFGMNRSKAKKILPSQIKTNFDSVAGAVEAKEELKDVVDFLKNPDKYKRLGAKLTKGVLLVGEPGNGKTLLAKAVAGEANCPFYSVSGSDFIEIFVGVGAARVRDLFAQARRDAPCIIFIDEIDAVGRQRGLGMGGGGHDEREQTLNQLLTEMDGFESGNSAVIVMAATNRPDVLDKALLRPGRFDRRVDVPYPDLKSREDILKVHSIGVKIDSEVDMKKMARGTPGFTGADLANLINEAAINASKHNQDRVLIKDFEEARDKIMLGKELKTVLLNDRERNLVAYHEAGHALITLMMPTDCDPLHKVTIIPRGKALGVTHSLPEREKHSISKEEMVAKIMMAMGGRAAEEIVFNKLETGAYSDFKHASDIARKMVCFYGMSDKLGPVTYHQNHGEFQYSQETANVIDEEVRNILKSCYSKAVELLKAHRDKLDKLAQALLEKETMFAGEIYNLLGIEPREEHLLR